MIIYIKRTRLCGAILIILLANACSINPIGQVPPVVRETGGAERVISKTLPGSTREADYTEDANTPLGQTIDAYIRSNHPLFSGTVLVASQGQVLLSKGYLWSDWELETPNRRSTKFRIASITKPITALAILMLQERGLLDVQDPICKYLPDCPQAWEEITIHQLLSHTSGIPEYTRLKDALVEAVQPVAVEDLISRFKDEPLEFTPGEKFSYSNSGYILLGYILEQVAQQPYAVFLEENIFEPLKMQDSGLDNNRVVLKDRAHGFIVENNRILNSNYLNMTNAYAAGGLYSTADDLYRLDQALSSDLLVSEATLEQIFTPFVETPASGGHYGYGWEIGESQGHALIGHEGRIFGFHALLERYPEDEATIILLSNVETEDLERLREGIEGLLFAEQ